MISTVLVSSNTPLTNYVRGVCAISDDFSIVGSLDGAKAGYAVARILSAYAPELLLLDVSDEDRQSAVAAVVLQIQSQSPATAIVPICSPGSPAVLQLADTLGLVPPLSPPFGSDDLETAAIGALSATVDTGRGFLAVFAPARPGSGATTVSLNAAYQVARNRNFRTLFIEVDEEMGAASILLDDGGLDIAAGDGRSFLTEPGLRQHILRVGPLAVITGVRLRALTKMNRWAMLRLVTCARSCHDFVFIRVPSVTHGNVKPLLSVARKICIVATPDLPSLSMARRRFAEIRTASGPCRVVVILNRCNGDLSERHFRDILDHDQVELVPDAPKLVQQSWRESGVVEAHGHFSRAICSVASKVTGGAAAAPPSRLRPSFALLSRLFAAERA